MEDNINSVGVGRYKKKKKICENGDVEMKI